jgi:hypothetical protein
MANGLDVRVSHAVIQQGFSRMDFRFLAYRPGCEWPTVRWIAVTKPRGLSSARTSSSVKTAIKQYTAPALTSSQLEANNRSPALGRAIFVFVMWT